MSVDDRRKIRRLKHEYCYRIDEGDYEKWVELFAEDGLLTVGKTYTGHDELSAFATDTFDSMFDRTAHIVANPLIDVDGETATGRWYLMLLYRTPDGDVGWNQTIYEDEYRLVDGEWKIASSASITHIEG